jgi:pimeloyl-ACP methyl ester carboxylesterase
MADPIPPWPGALVTLDIGDVFVRATPVPQTPASHQDAGGDDASGHDTGRDDTRRDDAGRDDTEAAVFVHGLGGSSRNWTDIMDLLSRPGGPGPGPAGPVLDSAALDLPGFGYSPVPANGDYSIGARAAAVIALIDKRGNWPVHLVGNSLGGAICTRVAAQRPDLVRTLTLISPALPDLHPRLMPLRVAAISVPRLGRWALGRLALVSAEARTNQMIRGLYADPTRIHPDRIREEIAEVTRRDGLGYQNDVLIGSVRAIVAEYTRFGPKTLWRDAARVTAPTLVIHGSHDRLVSPTSAARAARKFRSAQAVVLPQIGHVAMMERPDLVASVMRGFFAMAESVGPAGRVQVAGVDRTGVDRTGVDRSGVDRTRVDRTGVDRTGVDRTGVDRTGDGQAEPGQARRRPPSGSGELSQVPN